MGPAKKFYSLNPGESLEELRRQRGINLCELLDEIDKIENQTERSIPCKELAFENLSEDDKFAQELLKKLRGALNKLAPDNFYTQLMEMQCNLPVHNLHLMRMFVRQLIQKASKDTFYSQLYAYACKALSSIELVELPEDDDSIDTFGALVLDECYKYFCYNRSSLNWFFTRDPNREELISLDRKEYIKRKTLVGLVRFIGGLFKADLLSVKETFEYIKKLQSEVNEKSIEGLCCLLTSYGKDLEAAALESEFAGDWCATWERIANLSKKESNLPLRQMFMLMDLLDLMNNGWVPKETYQLRAPLSHIEILMDYQEMEKVMPKKSKAKTPKKKNKNSIVQPSESVDVSDSIIADDSTVVMTEQEIIQLLKSDGDIYNKLSNWEIKNFEGRKTWFVYSLMRAILRVSIDGNTLNQSKFTEHIELLKKYISSRQAEVACMYAVQYLIVVEMSNPKGLLENITSLLYKTRAVTYIGLLDWRENWSKHPLLEVRGRSAAHISLASLFMKLFWESTRPNYKSIVKELNSFDLEHFVSSSKLPPEIAKHLNLERSQPTLLEKDKSRIKIEEEEGGGEEVTQESVGSVIDPSEESLRNSLLTLLEKLSSLSLHVPEEIVENPRSKAERKKLKREKKKQAATLTEDIVSPPEFGPSTSRNHSTTGPRLSTENGTKTSSETSLPIVETAKTGKRNYISRAPVAGRSQVTIIPIEYPSVQLSKDQSDEIKSYIISMIDGLDVKGDVHPEFSRFSYHRGGCIIACDNHDTKNWLTSIIENYTISGGIALCTGSMNENGTKTPLETSLPIVETAKTEKRCYVSRAQAAGGDQMAIIPHEYPSIQLAVSKEQKRKLRREKKKQVAALSKNTASPLELEPSTSRTQSTTGPELSTGNGPKTSPEISLPTVETARIPEISLPTVETARIPEISLPTVETARIPEISLPTVETARIPEISLPTVETARIPEISLPTAETAKIPEISLPTAETARIGKRNYVARALAAGGSQVVIIPSDYPSTMLSWDQSEEVVSYIVDMIDGLEVHGDIHPQFSGKRYRLGGCIIVCNNQHTKDWLTSIIENHTITGGIMLRIGNMDELKKIRRMSAYFGGEKIPGHQILRRLRIQNANIQDIDKWTLRFTRVKDNGVYIVFQVPETSVHDLEKRNFLMSYSFSTVNLTVVLSRKWNVPTNEEKAKAVITGNDSKPLKKKGTVVAVGTKTNVVQNAGGGKSFDLESTVETISQLSLGSGHLEASH